MAGGTTTFLPLVMFGHERISNWQAGYVIGKPDKL